jgi:glycosyltransferase involved in cell wall biosynthesis
VKINKISQINRRILFIEPCNYIDEPLGGQLTMAKTLINVIGPKMALVGWTIDPSAPIGKWHKRIINGNEYDFFALKYVPERILKRPWIPTRLKNWIAIRRYCTKISAIGITNILISEHSVMLAYKFHKGVNVCYLYPGVDSQLTKSRYIWAKYLSGIFDYLVNRRVKKHATTILAAADSAAIKDLVHRSRGVLKGCNIESFPTRVNTKIFKPGNKKLCREKHSLPLDGIIVIYTGRIHSVKGWQLILESFSRFRLAYSNSTLIFIGEGNDRGKLESEIAGKGLNNYARVIGYQEHEIIAEYLQASDLFVMASLQEGWPNSMVEALACGLPIVTTEYSSARILVKDGVNGYVVERDPGLYSNAMIKSIKLNGVEEYSVKEARKYSYESLENDLMKVWKI